MCVCVRKWIEMCVWGEHMILNYRYVHVCLVCWPVLAMGLPPGLDEESPSLQAQSEHAYNKGSAQYLWLRLGIIILNLYIGAH